MRYDPCLWPFYFFYKALGFLKGQVKSSIYGIS